MTSALANCLEQAISLRATADADALAQSLVVCNTPETFETFIRSLIETTFWQRKINVAPDLSALCAELARAVDGYFDTTAEPAYHSRRHFKEVCLALTLLLDRNSGAEDSVWAIADRNCWLLLLAAIGHDFGHEGRPNRSTGELEEKACYLVESFQEMHPGFHQSDLELVKDLIRATEPMSYATLTAVVNAPEAMRPIDAMKVLLVEADLFASMLPGYGVRLGTLLAQEFEPHAPTLAQLIASPEGRKGFLEAHFFVSPNSHQLGFNDVIRTAIIQAQH